MYIFDKEENMVEKITVACNENKCNGTFTLNRYRDDFSPRVHDECSKCKRFMSVKLSSINESRIVNREWI